MYNTITHHFFSLKNNYSTKKTKEPLYVCKGDGHYLKKFTVKLI